MTPTDLETASALESNMRDIRRLIIAAERRAESEPEDCLASAYERFARSLKADLARLKERAAK